MIVEYEVTDTFGGEANYSWVKRETEEVDEQHTSKRTMVRHIKSMMGATNQRCTVEDYGDNITVTPIGPNADCVVGFITLKYEELT